MNILDNIYHYIFQFIVIALFTVPTMLFIGWLIDKKVTSYSKKSEEKDRKERQTKIIKGFIHAVSELKEENKNIELDDAWIKEEEDDKEICFFYKNHLVYTNLRHDVSPRFYACRDEFWIDINNVKYTILRTLQEIDDEIEVEKRALDYVVKRIEEMGWKSKECQPHPKFRGNLREFVKKDTVLYLSQDESRMKVSVHNRETGPCWGVNEVVLATEPIGRRKDSFLKHVDELVEALNLWEKFI